MSLYNTSADISALADAIIAAFSTYAEAATINVQGVTSGEPLEIEGNVTFDSGFGSRVSLTRTADTEAYTAGDVIGAGLNRKEAKTIRLKEWKRETKKNDRKKSKEDRIKVWEEETGLKWES